MATSRATFRGLSFEQQLRLVWHEGTLLAQRPKPGQTLLLFLLEGGFLCEVSIRHEQCRAQHLRHFAATDTERLEKYVPFIFLSELSTIL